MIREGGREGFSGSERTHSRRGKSAGSSCSTQSFIASPILLGATDTEQNGLQGKIVFFSNIYKQLFDSWNHSDWSFSLVVFGLVFFCSFFGLVLVFLGNGVFCYGISGYC